MACVVFALISLAAFYLNYYLACTNPGFLMGSEKDVQKLAGSYDPKHYQVQSDRKVKDVEKKKAW